MFCIVNHRYWRRHLIKIWNVKRLETKCVHTVKNLIMGETESW